jgi:hypothetical protein
MDAKQNNITAKLQNLVKKRKTTVVVIKAGSIKNVRRNSGDSFGEDYYPSYSDS